MNKPLNMKCAMAVLAAMTAGCELGNENLGEGGDPMSEGGSEGVDEGTTDGGLEEGSGSEESGAETSGEGIGPVCPAATSGTPVTYSVAFFGFPEIAGDTLVDPGAGLDLSLACTVDAMGLADGELSLELGCDHPEAGDVTVVLTTAATGIPAGLELDEAVTFEVGAFINLGGFVAGGKVFYSLANTELQHYAVIDDQGLVFGASEGGNGDGQFGSLEIEKDLNCPSYVPCDVGDPINAYIRASVDGIEGAEVFVQVGETQTLTGDGASWDVNLFYSSYTGNCHPLEPGNMSLVRQP